MHQALAWEQVKSKVDWPVLTAQQRRRWWWWWWEGCGEGGEVQPVLSRGHLGTLGAPTQLGVGRG